MTPAETEPAPNLSRPPLDNFARSTAPLPLKRLQGIVKRVLPSTLVGAMRVVAELRPVSNSLIKRIGSVASAWRRAGAKPVLPSEAKSVVFVCHGNIMRSPVAEAMLKRELEKHSPTNVTVTSAGMHAINGRVADPRAQTVAPEFGVSVTAHQAQVVTQTLVDSSDLLVVMDIQNAAEFLLRYPQASNKLFMLRQFSEHSRGPGRDIPDPYPADEEFMRQCCGMLRECVDGLSAQLRAGQKKAASC
jgi:protein-tyrosine phosphatase